LREDESSNVKEDARVLGSLRSAKAAAVVLMLGVASFGTARAATTRSCLNANAFAPEVTRCTQPASGSFSTTSALSHDVTADIDYVGTLESTLSWRAGTSSGTRTFRCTYAQAIKRVCTTAGSFPPVGVTVTFTQTCKSIVPATGDQPFPQAIEGGVGPWNCSVSF
jgi:hypothetical protein